MTEALVPVVETPPAAEATSGEAHASSAAVALPRLIVDAGPAAVARFLEFFAGRIANDRPRAAYARAVGQFLGWCEARGLRLEAVSPLHVAAYIRTHPGSPPTVKQHLAAILKIPNDDGLAPQLSVSLFGEVGRADDANRRPVVLENLPDRSLAAAGTLEVDVSGAFVDPDGEALSYTVSSSAPHVVATRAVGALVTLTAASEGVAAIRVTATDPGGLTATQSFGVTVGRPNRPPAPVGALRPLTLGVDEAAVRVDVPVGCDGVVVWEPGGGDAGV